MIAAAHSYNRIVQIGMQSRSSEATRKRVEFMKRAGSASVYMAQGPVFQRRPSIGHKGDEPVPRVSELGHLPGAGPVAPFTRCAVHYNWHWYWDTGNGDIGNQGIHEMDMARWGLGVGLARTCGVHGRKVRLQRRPGDAEHTVRRAWVR